MLQYRTVYPETLGLLKKLMSLPQLFDFFLVGGTALALQIGHRISVDLDLFTQMPFEPEKIQNDLSHNVTIFDAVRDSGKLNLIAGLSETAVNRVKVDLIRYPYPLLKPVMEIEGIRMLSLEDTIAMKLSAVAGIGSKKDFYDIYFLLKSFTLLEMFAFFSLKFPETNHFHVLKSLSYFEDAEIEPDPLTIDKINWGDVKKTIIKKSNKILQPLTQPTP